MPILKPGDRIANKYRIIRRVGSGGMGVVYQAVHERLNQTVALKVLHTFHRHSKTDVARFEHEVKAMSVVNNPHIARALDADLLEDGSLYLVMEYLEGRDLRAELSRRHTIPYAEAVAYIVQACDGVAGVHDAGIVHRDLKPQNLFITQLDSARSLKVLDFGLAKFTQSESVSLTTSGLTVGTPLYMSPEQLCRPQEVSTQSDVWSLGVVLYELIVGVSPFQADSPGAVVAAVVLEEPVPLSEVAPEVPKALSNVLRRVFVKSPSKRLSSVRELAELISPLGMPRDAIRVTPPSQEPTSFRKRTTLRPELSEQIQRDISQFDAANESARPTGGVNSVRHLPVLAGISLPLATRGADEPSNEAIVAHDASPDSAALRRRGRRIMVFAALGLPVLIGFAWARLNHRQAPIARVQALDTATSIQQPAPLTSGSEPSIASSVPLPTIPDSTRASGTKGTTHPLHSRSLRTPPSAATSAPPVPAVKNPTLAADGKPLHL